MQAFELYEKYGNAGYIGEEVSQLQHAVQTAQQAEIYCNEKKIPFHIKREVILGAFFHDIGHLLEFIPTLNLPKMEDLGILNHEIHGAKFLKSLGYSSLICEMVENHINTKRYLITKNSNYYDNLSSASQSTFAFQGGTMTDDERINFENNSHFRLHINLRKWDENAKSTDPEILKQTNDYFNKLKSFK